MSRHRLVSDPPHPLSHPTPFRVEPVEVADSAPLGELLLVPGTTGPIPRHKHIDESAPARDEPSDDPTQQPPLILVAPRTHRSKRRRRTCLAAQSRRSRPQSSVTSLRSRRPQAPGYVPRARQGAPWPQRRAPRPQEPRRSCRCQTRAQGFGGAATRRAELLRRRGGRGRLSRTRSIDVASRPTRTAWYRSPPPSPRGHPLLSLRDVLLS